MTLDGHLKTGLAATLLASAMLPHYWPELVSIGVVHWVLLAFWFGNIGPDLTEMKIIKHRTHTHYPWYYVVVGGMTYAAITWKPEWVGLYWGSVILAYCAGALSHIVCDIPYGGIPYIKPTRPVTLIRLPFDGWGNRLVEHGVLAALLLTFALFHTDIDQLSQSVDAILTSWQKEAPAIPASEEVWTKRPD